MTRHKKKERSGRSHRFKSRKLLVLGEPETPKIIKWIMRIFGRWIKNERQAAYVLFSLVTLIFLISFFLFFETWIKAKIKIFRPDQGGIVQKGFYPEIDAR